jgi:hypothetical protein
VVDAKTRKYLEALVRRRPPRERVTIITPPRDTPDRVGFRTDRDGTALQGSLVLVGDRLVLESLTISVGQGSVTTATLRAVRLPDLLAEVRAALMLRGYGRLIYVQTGKPVHSPQQETRARKIAEAAEQTELARGRRGYGDAHYRRVAFAYLDRMAQGQHRGVLAALAAAESERLGRSVPIETMRTWINQARRRGFLGPGEPGRASATPGPRLYSIEGDNHE